MEGAGLDAYVEYGAYICRYYMVLGDGGLMMAHCYILSMLFAVSAYCYGIVKGQDGCSYDRGLARSNLRKETHWEGPEGKQACQIKDSTYLSSCAISRKASWCLNSVERCLLSELR